MKRFLTFFLISFFILIPNVFADSSYANLYAFSFGSHQNTPFQFGLGAGASSTYNFGVVVDTGKVSYNYLTMNICATISPELDGITNSDSSVQYFVEEYKLVNNHSTCYVNNNKGNGYYLFLQIGRWNIGSQTSNASTKLTFKNNSSWYGLIRVNSLVLGNTDDSVDISGLNAVFESNGELKDAITNSSSQINGNLNDIENSINNTNDKLDNANDKLNDLYEQNQETHDRLHTQIKEQEKTNEELGDLNDNITNTDGPSLSALENSAGWLPAGPIDSILNLPLSLLNNISSNLSKQCQPVVVTLPFVHTDFTLPCLNTIYSQIGGLNTFLTTIGVIASAFLLFSYLLKLYRWVDNTLSFRENNEIDNWGGI